MVKKRNGKWCHWYAGAIVHFAYKQKIANKQSFFHRAGRNGVCLRHKSSYEPSSHHCKHNGIGPLAKHSTLIGNCRTSPFLLCNSQPNQVKWGKHYCCKMLQEKTARKRCRQSAARKPVPGVPGRWPGRTQRLRGRCAAPRRAGFCRLGRRQPSARG